MKRLDQAELSHSHGAHSHEHSSTAQSMTVSELLDFALVFWHHVFCTVHAQLRNSCGGLHPLKGGDREASQCRLR